MTVLCTGGLGFIGSNLVDTLLYLGHEVTVLDDYSTGNVKNLEFHRNNPKLEVVRGDIRDLNLVKRVCDHKDVVFHMAAHSRIQTSIVDPIHAFTTNIIGTANLLEASRQCGVKRFVYSASSSAYGEKNQPPLVENMIPDCLNPYSLSKKTGEELVDLYQKFYGLSTISLRYFNVFGPRHPEEGNYATVVAIFRKQKREGKKLTIVGSGTQSRDMTFVGDVVHANMLSMMARDVHGIFNIGTGINYTINEIAEMIGGEVEFIPARPGEAQTTLADNTKARQILGWKPQVTFKQGLLVLDQFEKKNQLVIL